MGEPRFYCEKCQRMFVPWPGRIKCGECGALATRKQVRFLIILNARIENVGKCQSCMVSKLRIVCKQLVRVPVRFTPELPGLLAGRQEPTLTAGHHMVPPPTWGQALVAATLHRETAAMKARLAKKRLELAKKRQREGQRMAEEQAEEAAGAGVRESKSCVVC